MLGLTHPVIGKRWYGFKVGGHFFRLVDGDRYLAVLPGRDSLKLVDTIQFPGDEQDPRPDIRRLATDWTRQRGLKRVQPTVADSQPSQG